MEDLSINITHTFEALSLRGSRSVEVHIYIYIKFRCVHMFGLHK